jgi:hypothetical protein
MKLLILLCTLATSMAHAGLKWQTTQKSVVFRPGQPVYRAEFPFKNTGKTNVTITDIKTGCACCTTGKVDKYHYAPGETGTLKMNVDLRGKTVPIAKAVIVEIAGENPVSVVLEIKTEDGKSVTVPRWNFGSRK